MWCWFQLRATALADHSLSWLGCSIGGLFLNLQHDCSTRLAIPWQDDFVLYACVEQRMARWVVHRHNTIERVMLCCGESQYVVSFGSFYKRDNNLVAYYHDRFRLFPGRASGYPTSPPTDPYVRN